VNPGTKGLAVSDRLTGLLCAFTLLFGVAAGAAEESKDALVQEILAFSDSTDTFDNIFAQMREPLIRKIGEKDPQKAVETDRALARQVADIKAEMIREFTPLLTANFTEQELREIRDFGRAQTAFFQSDTGRKMREIMSPNNKQVVEVASKHIQRLMALLATVGASAP
jgi:hypothetical protein